MQAVKITVDSSEVDKALEKVELLTEKLKEAKALINALAPQQMQEVTLMADWAEEMAAKLFAPLTEQAQEPPPPSSQV